MFKFAGMITAASIRTGVSSKTEQEYKVSEIEAVSFGGGQRTSVHRFSVGEELTESLVARINAQVADGALPKVEISNISISVNGQYLQLRGTLVSIDGAPVASAPQAPKSEKPVMASK